MLEKTQRRLCRLLFLVGCVLPTLAVAGYTTNRLRPGFTETLLQAAGERFGVTVRCRSLETPRPGVYRLAELVVSDPSTGSMILACDRLTLRRQGSLWRVAGGDTGVGFAGLDGPWVQALLDSEVEVSGTLGSLRPEASDRFSGVSVRLVTVDNGTRTLRMMAENQASCQIVHAAGSTRTVIETADRQISTAWLPGRPITAFSEGSSTFRGGFKVDQRSDSLRSSGSASGLLVVTSFSANGLSADRGVLEIDSLHWTDRRLDRFEGQIDLRDGHLSGALVWGACEHLETAPFDHLQELWQDPARRDSIPFSQLRCEVELSAEGLTLVGGCGEIDGVQRGGAIAHAIVALDGEPLLREPATRPLPVERLVRAWFPEQRAELPAASARVEMMRLLPVGGSD